MGKIIPYLRMILLYWWLQVLVQSSWPGGWWLIKYTFSPASSAACSSLPIHSSSEAGSTSSYNSHLRHDHTVWHFRRPTIIRTANYYAEIMTVLGLIYCLRTDPLRVERDGCKRQDLYITAENYYDEDEDDGDEEEEELTSCSRSSSWC